MAKKSSAIVRFQIPYLHLAIGTTRIQSLVANEETTDDTFMADQHVRLLHGIQIPHTDLVVLLSQNRVSATRCEVEQVGAHTHLAATVNRVVGDRQTVNL